MTGLPIPDRPPFFLALLPQLLQMRARTRSAPLVGFRRGSSPDARRMDSPRAMLPDRLDNLLMITVHPSLLSYARYCRAWTLC